MKKFLFLAIAAAAMTSCSQDEVMEVAEKQAISFGNVFVGKSTRAAADNTYGAKKLIEKFNVYGTVTGTNGTVNIFNGNDVTKPGDLTEYNSSTAWTLEGPEQYWVEDADYAFAAVVNEEIATVATTDTYGMPATLTYSTDNTGTKDLLYATATVEKATTDQGIVAFTFDHLLSKVWFTVTSDTKYTETKNTDGTTTKSGYYYSVKNIKVTNFETGTYTINGGTWAGTKANNIEFGDVEQVTNTAEKTNATQMLLIPNAADFKITFDVELYVNGQHANTKSYESTVSNDLVKGHSYNFIIALEQGNKPIKFSVASVNTWVEDLNNDQNTTNDAISLTFTEVTPTTPAN